MPMTVNGFGTSVCGGRGDVGWGSCDAMEWLTAFYMPLIPIKAVHTFDWNGNQYRMIPIRWSGDLVCRTFFSRWLWGIGGIGVILGIIFFAELNKRGANPFLLVAAVGLVLLSVLIGLVLRWTDDRNQRIRRVLGAMTVGSCDPADLPDRLLDEMAGDPRLAYGTETFADAVEPLLQQGSYARAMWAARIATVLEDRAEGEALTNQILDDPDVRDAIEIVRQTPDRWAKVMQSSADHQPAAEEPVDVEEVDETPQDDRVRRRRRRDD